MKTLISSLARIFYNFSGRPIGCPQSMSPTVLVLTARFLLKTIKGQKSCIILIFREDLVSFQQVVFLPHPFWRLWRCPWKESFSIPPEVFLCVLKIMSFTILVLAEDPDLVLRTNLFQFFQKTLLCVLKACLLPSSSLLKTLKVSFQQVANRPCFY